MGFVFSFSGTNPKQRKILLEGLSSVFGILTILDELNLEIEDQDLFFAGTHPKQVEIERGVVQLLSKDNKINSLYDLALYSCKDELYRNEPPSNGVIDPEAVQFVVDLWAEPFPEAIDRGKLKNELIEFYKRVSEREFIGQRDEMAVQLAAQKILIPELLASFSKQVLQLQRSSGLDGLPETIATLSEGQYSGNALERQVVAELLMCLIHTSRNLEDSVAQFLFRKFIESHPDLEPKLVEMPLPLLLTIDHVTPALKVLASFDPQVQDPKLAQVDIPLVRQYVRGEISLASVMTQVNKVVVDEMDRALELGQLVVESKVDALDDKKKGRRVLEDFAEAEEQDEDHFSKIIDWTTVQEDSWLSDLDLDRIQTLLDEGVIDKFHLERAMIREHFEVKEQFRAQAKEKDRGVQAKQEAPLPFRRTKRQK